MARHTGDYVKHIRTGKVEFCYYTFTPRLLMGGGFFKNDKELSDMLISTHHALGTLKGIVRYAPNRELFIELSLLMESCYSRLIDYGRPFLYETLIGGEYANYATLIASAYIYSMEKEINVPVLLDICKLALYGIKTDKSVGLREKQIYLSSISNFKEYNPTAPEHILPAMLDIMDYLYNNTSDDVLIKAALAHYQFETIHPFERYNGVVGRILISMMLRSICSEAAWVMSFSEFLCKSGTKYFDLISSTQDSGRYLRWLKFFIHGIHYAANQAINRFDRYEQIIKEDETMINSNKTQHLTV